MSKAKVSNIDALLENLLNERQPIERPTSMADFDNLPEPPHSLDQAIDRYLVQYERESIPTSEVYENTSIDGLLNFLLEQEEETPADDAPEADLPGGDLDLGGDDLDLGAGGLDLGEDEDADEENKEAQEPPAVVATPKINLQDFARSVARLVNNMASLIDLQTLVLNRAEKYIQSNYDQKTARELMGILDTSYDLRPVDISTHQTEPSKYPEPHTGVTGPVGG